MSVLSKKRPLLPDGRHFRCAPQTIRSSLRNASVRPPPTTAAAELARQIRQRPRATSACDRLVLHVLGQAVVAELPPVA